MEHKKVCSVVKRLSLLGSSACGSIINGDLDNMFMFFPMRVVPFFCGLTNSVVVRTHCRSSVSGGGPGYVDSLAHIHAITTEKSLCMYTLHVTR